MPINVISNARFGIQCYGYLLCYPDPRFARAASNNGGDTVVLAGDPAVQESELAVDGAGLADRPSCAIIIIVHSKIL